MDFQRLPQNIFLDILGHLNVRDRVRTQRVSRFWYENCTMALGERPVSFPDFFKQFEKIHVDAFRRLLQLCHHRIESIFFHFYTADLRTGHTVELLSVMAEFNYSKLDYIHISQIPADYILIEVGCLMAQADCLDFLITLIRNASNLNSLNLQLAGRVGNDFFTRLLDNSCSAVENIDLYGSDRSGVFITSDTFRLMGQRLKNLKSFVGCWQFKTTGAGGMAAGIENLNYFFGECTQLRRMSYQESDIFYRVPNFWKLQLLEEMSINYEADDTFLHSLSSSFPLLKELEITLSDDVTASGVACLDRLKNLKKVEIIDVSMEMVRSNGFVDVVNNLGGLMSLTIQIFSADAAGLKEAAIKFVDSKSRLKVCVEDQVQNVIPVLEYLVNVGIKFECRETDGVYSSIPTLISNLKNNSKPDSYITLWWKSM